MTTPELSVFLPARNAESTVAAALRSCLDQEGPLGEVVVVDDGSSDATAEVVAEVARDDARVRLVRREGTGDIVATSRVGLAACRAPLVARMDADDLSLPGRLAAQVATLEADPDLVACACAVEAPGAGEGMARFVEWNNRLLSPEQIAAARFIELPVVNPTMMFRVAAVEEAGGYREVRWAEDYDLWLRVLAAGGKIAKLPELHYRWNDSPGRLTRSDPRYSLERNIEAKAHFLARLPGVAHRGIALCGAGPTGKRLARALAEEGVEVARFYEVHPRRIGEAIAGIPVHDSAALDPPSATGPAVLVAAVGTPGGRSKIRALVAAAGFREGVDFFCAA